MLAASPEIVDNFTMQNDLWLPPLNSYPQLSLSTSRLPAVSALLCASALLLNQSACADETVPASQAETKSNCPASSSGEDSTAEQTDSLPEAQTGGPLDVQSGNAERGAQSIQPKEQNLPLKYIGNSFSLKFHRPSCPFAKAMWSERVVLFHFRKEAISGGFKPCRYCLPPVWKSVSCKLLPRSAPASSLGQNRTSGEPAGGPSSEGQASGTVETLMHKADKNLDAGRPRDQEKSIETAY